MGSPAAGPGVRASRAGSQWSAVGVQHATVLPLLPFGLYRLLLTSRFFEPFLRLAECTTLALSRAEMDRLQDQVTKGCEERLGLQPLHGSVLEAIVAPPFENCHVFCDSKAVMFPAPPLSDAPFQHCMSARNMERQGN